MSEYALPLSPPTPALGDKKLDLGDTFGERFGDITGEVLAEADLRCCCCCCDTGGKPSKLCLVEELGESFREFLGEFLGVLIPALIPMKLSIVSTSPSMLASSSDSFI